MGRAIRNTNGKRGVIFDLDGVLVDTGSYHKQSWYELAAREGLGMSDELFYSTFGMQNNAIIPILAGRQSFDRLRMVSEVEPVSAEEIERMSEWKERRYRELIADKLELMEGAQPLLEDLKNNGFLLAIGSSAPRANLDVVLKRCSISDFFDAFVVGEDVRNSKPSPDTFLKAAEKLKLPPRQCVVVEDSLAGVQAGKAAGMAVIAITTTRKRRELKDADMIVDSLTELNANIFNNLLKVIPE
ncbi:MAG: hypothetical protein A2167_05535 [Planctomycetes bacterium RBG_13_46_10]|nr:MAG: hypothetical protein A2167_05535 [Planctomycetes bacterium RBG_13_46_10]